MDRPRPKPQERSRIPILLGMLALAAGGFTTSLMIDRAGVRSAGELAPPGTARNAIPAPVTLRRPVAILGFKNTANRPEAAWIAGSLDQMLRIELVNDRRLRVLSDENVARMKTRLGITDADASSLAILGQIRAVVGADFVVLGSYDASSGQDSGPVRVEVSVVDTRTGEVVATVSESGDTGPITERLQQVSRQVREKLGAAPL